MSVRNLYASISGVSDIESINLTQGYGQSFDICTIKAGSSTKDLNETISVDMGYTDDHQTVFSGRIKQVTKAREDGTVTIIAKDILVDAADSFMVSLNPEDPFSRDHIHAQDLVQDLLNEANITSYSSAVPLTFTYGISAPVTFNLISVMDACNQIATMLAWHIYAVNGTVYFDDTTPYWRSGTTKNIMYGTGGHSDDPLNYVFCTDGSVTVADFPTYTIYDTILNMERTYSDENLRNRVVVYGRDGIVADAKASSPYLPADFYKSAVIASPLIDSGSMADAAANFNLNLYNKLTDSLTMDVLGDPQIRKNQFVCVGDDFIGIGKHDYWFIYEVNHTWGQGGYTTKMTLTK